MATVEVNSNGVHRTIVNYDVTNKVLKLEYISGPNAALSSNDHLAAYRLYIDENSDEGYMMALEHTKDLQIVTFNTFFLESQRHPAVIFLEYVFERTF